MTVKPVLADFTDDAVCMSSGGSAVHFQDRSQGNVTSWLWEFGDCTVSSERNPTHIYAGGTHSVRLTVAGPGYSDTVTKVNHIMLNVFVFHFPLKGDVNSDNVPGLADAIMALQILSGRDFLCQRWIRDIDVDGDVKIGPAEVSYILQKLSGLRPD